jgi:hypothetical protein
MLLFVVVTFNISRFLDSHNSSGLRAQFLCAWLCKEDLISSLKRPNCLWNCNNWSCSSYFNIYSLFFCFVKLTFILSFTQYVWESTLVARKSTDFEEFSRFELPWIRERRLWYAVCLCRVWMNLCMDTIYFRLQCNLLLSPFLSQHVSTVHGHYTILQYYVWIMYLAGAWAAGRTMFIRYSRVYPS